MYCDVHKITKRHGDDVKIRARPREGTKAGGSSKASSDPRPKALENSRAMTTL